ncbi:MAG: hypothetical protein JSS72_03005 [Armatimonadetes bacterium]|nr:hypothetical protein [Armatimonadota bacterium]
MDKGCGVILGVVLLLVMGVGFLMTSGVGNRGKQGGGQNAIPITAIGAVGTTQIPEAAVEMLAGQKAAATAQESSPEADLQHEFEALAQCVQFARVLEEGKKMGLNLKPEEVEQARMEALNRGLKEKLIEAGQLKPGATQAEMEAKLPPQIAQMREADAARTHDQLQNPNTSLAPTAEAVIELMQVKFAQDANITDADVKTYYTNYETHRLNFGMGAAGKQKAEAAKASFKSAKDFDAEMQAQKATAPLVLNHTKLLENPALKVIATTKQGEVTAPIEGEDGWSLYRLEATRTDYPQDLQKNSANYRAKIGMEIADKKVGKIMGGLEFSDVVWSSPIYKDMVDSIPIVTSRNVKSIVDFLQKVKADAGASARLANVLQANIYNLLINVAPAADKPKYEEQSIEVLSAYLQSAESSELRFKLIDLLIKYRNGAGAGEQLALIARGNFNPDAAGKVKYGKIAKVEAELKDKKMLAADQQSIIDKAQKDFLDALASKEQAEAQQKKAEEEDRKKSAAEAERLKKEAGAKGAPSIGMKDLTKPSSTSGKP